MYKVGDIVLIRASIIRKTEDSTARPVYRLHSLGNNYDLDFSETNIAGTVADIPNSPKEE
jgi:hypothetical protein